MLTRLKTWLGLIPYVSPLDQFLSKLNQSDRKLTTSEQTEVDKHQRVHQARDKAVVPPQKPAGWKHF